MTQAEALDASAYFDPRRNLHRRFWEAAQDYDGFVAGAEPPQREEWEASAARVRIQPAQRELLGGFTRQMRVLVVATPWSGDCVLQVPIIHHLAQASPVITARVLERDAHPQMRDEVRICGAAKVPVAVFMTEDFFECSRMGDRTLTSYRALARRALGPNCPMMTDGLDEDELAASVQDWMDEFERVQLMMRLSPYLRERYDD